MNMKRILLVLAFFLVLGTAGALFLLPLMRAPRIDSDSFARLQEKMTLAEVEAVLGPERNESDGNFIAWTPRDGKLVSAMLPTGQPAGVSFLNADAAKGEKELVWVSRSGLIAATFGESGRLQEKYFSEVHSLDPLHVKVLRRFGL